MAEQNLIPGREYTFTVVLETVDEGGYVATFPAIPDLATQGETEDEVREMAADCLRCYLEGRVKDGLPLPDSEPIGTPSVDGQVKVSLQRA